MRRETRRRPPGPRALRESAPRAPRAPRAPCRIPRSLGGSSAPDPPRRASRRPPPRTAPAAGGRRRWELAVGRCPRFQMFCPAGAGFAFLARELLGALGEPAPLLGGVA